jgi:hypothetical protein
MKIRQGFFPVPKKGYKAPLLANSGEVESCRRRWPETNNADGRNFAPCIRYRESGSLRQNRSALLGMRKPRIPALPVTRPHRAAAPDHGGPAFAPRRGEFICLIDRFDATSPRESSPPSSWVPRRPTPVISAPPAVCGGGCSRFGSGGWRFSGTGFR